MEAGFTFSSTGVSATEAAGEAWGALLKPGDVVLLIGDLGMGKTTLVRGLARGAGVDYGVKSPTFAIHLQYPGRVLLHHIDLYRIQDVREFDELDLDGWLLDGGVALVEWAERLGELAPRDAIRVFFSETGSLSRDLRIVGPEPMVSEWAGAVGAEVVREEA